MWKKKESEPATPRPVGPSEPQPSRAAASVRRADRAVIGATLRIHGEISGEEELVVQGQVDGQIVVRGQAVTVGKAGKVKANIHARSIRIEGEVRGDLFGEQEVIIEASGDVEGNLIAPSVRLENGSRFKGSIDMESAKRAAATETPARSAAQAGSEKPGGATGGKAPSLPSSSEPGPSQSHT